MKALITGGSGFIGSHLADHLVALGIDTVALDDLSTGDTQNIAHLLDDPAFRFIKATVLDEEAVALAMQGVDIVYHLAATVGVKLIVEEPLRSLTNTIFGSEVVLRAAAMRGIPTLVTSSSEVYGKYGSSRMRETDDRVLGSPLVSRWSYSESKAIEESMAFAYWKESGVPNVIVRLFNTVGPRQTGAYGMVIPRFVEQALRGVDLTVHGDGKQTRCFAYVGDVVEAMVRLAGKEEWAGEVFNIGSEREIQIIDLARLTIDVLRSSSKVRLVPYDDAYPDGFQDLRRRVPDVDKVRRAVGFSAETELEEIILRVAEHVGPRLVS